MKRHLALLTAAVVFCLTPRITANVDAAAKLRHLSFAVKDAPPSPEEARRFAAGQVTLDALIDEWLTQEDHRTRVRRFFYDMFGTQDFSIASAAQVELRKNGLGIYKLDDKPDCGMAQSTAVGAWWLESGQTVRVCNNTLSEAITFGTLFEPDYVQCTWPTGMEDPRCGCGPDLILCIPEEKIPEMARASYYEFVDRGLFMYEAGRSWYDLFAANLFYGTRYQYYLYLWHGWMWPFGSLPSPEDLQRLKGLPVDAKALTAYPEQGAERAPVVTGINFMVQYNNFRSRIRVLSERLLCQPVSGTLNTDNIQHLVNLDLSEADKDHATKAGCAVCHYALDNLGSTILGWSDLGFYDSQPMSRVGHVFGQQGEGARFLMRGFVERGPDFHQCMARRAWETFSGVPWNVLAASDRRTFEAMATGGPRPLIRGVLKSEALRRMR